MTVTMPTRWINKTLFIAGGVGVLFQVLATIYALIHQIDLQWHWWFNGLAPILCLLWGLVPKLQLQKEPTH